VSFLALFGLLFLVKKRPRLVIPMLILLILAIYINSSTRDWFGGGGYGLRKFSSELAIFIVGYSGLIQAIPEIARKPVAAILGIGLFFHQWILMRFGLEESIGGRVGSMYPEYRWSEVSYGEMIKSITNHFYDIINSPRDFFVLVRSPIAELLDGRWPGSQVYSLLIAATILLLIWLLVSLIRGRDKDSAMWYWLGAILIVVSILFTNFWIFNWA
jgi:hypothetical protein